MKKRVKGLEVHASGPKLVDRNGYTWTMVKDSRLVEDEYGERYDRAWIEARHGGPLVPKGAVG